MQGDGDGDEATKRMESAIGQFMVATSKAFRTLLNRPEIIAAIAKKAGTANE
jgi:hypothetical protein